MFRLYKDEDKNDNEKYKLIFNYLIIPLIAYSTIGHLVLSDKVARSIGWKKSPFQLELGYFTLSLLIVSIYSSSNNYPIKTYISLSYVWIIFIMFAAINHIYEILKFKNYSINNIFPIIVSLITCSLVIYYSKFSKYLFLKKKYQFIKFI